MPKIILLGAAAVVLIATGAISAGRFVARPCPVAEKRETVDNAPPDAPYAPARAVDHVLSMRHTGVSEPVLHNLIVARSGDWLRRDRTYYENDGWTEVTYSNVGSGVSVTSDRDEAGRPNFLHVRRNPAASAFTRVRTGERDALLGEACDVWLYGSNGPEPYGLNCVTEDGVELWSRRYYSSGELMGGARAISLVRRRVEPSETRPPPDLFDWERWRRGVAASRGAPNDEVRLISQHGEQAVIRRRGGWSYRDGADEILHRGERSLVLSHEASGLFLHYRADSGGPLELSIRRRQGAAGSTDPPVSENRAATILGERCTWFNVTSNEHVRYFECRTQDGIAVWTRRFDSFSSSLLQFKATDIRRGGVSEDDISPPAAAFDWGH